MTAQNILDRITSVKKVRELMEFIKQTIQLRNCSLQPYREQY